MILVKKDIQFYRDEIDKNLDIVKGNIQVCEEFCILSAKLKELNDDHKHDIETQIKEIKVLNTVVKVIEKTYLTMPESEIAKLLVLNTELTEACKERIDSEKFKIELMEVMIMCLEGKAKCQKEIEEYEDNK